MTARPAKVTTRHRELATALVEAVAAPRARGRAARIAEAHQAMREGWRECPEDLPAAVESARAILSVIRRDKRAHGSGREDNRVFRVSDKLWEAGQAVAKAEGRTLAAALREFLEDYVARGTRA